MLIQMPANGWKPRPHQQRLWNYFVGPKTDDPNTSFRFDGTGKRAMAIWHRRAGKDDVALNLTGKASVTRPATYWHMLPEYEQGRKAIWNAVNPHTGRRRIDEAFPESWRANYDDKGMFIRFKWGATWQVVGSDNYQNLVGTPPAGIVLSEWAKAHPGAWAYLAPILVENKGWALAISTPEGRNHCHAMYETWKKTPGYFGELLTIEDSMRLCRAAGLQPSVTLEDVEIQRAEYHGLFGVEAGDALIEQEWYCSFAAAILGAYFGKQISRAEHEGRICALDRVPGYPINTAFDIGVDDPMAIWVFQVGPGWLHILDYIEGSNEGFDFYCDWLAERDYVPTKNHRGELIGTDWVPHDAKQREPGAPKARTRIQTLFALGRNPRLVPDHKPMDRINAGRRLLASPNTYFDADRCSVGLDMLRAYKQEYDVKNRVFRKTPKHDFASHGADAWGHLAVAVEFPTVREKQPARTKIEVPPLTVNDLLKQTKPERTWV
jgi:phage terminase large subunit